MANDPGLELTPSILNLSAYQGESVSATVSAYAARDFAGVVNVQVKDLDGGFMPNIAVRAFSQRMYSATLQTAATLGAGVRSGTVNISLCKDDPLTCAQPHAGSPWKLPYSINVRPFASATGLTALVPGAQVADWGTYQGGAAHTGSVPMRVDPARIVPRFSWFAPVDNTQISQASHSPVVTIDGGAYFTINGSIYALGEQSGSLLWSAKVSTNWDKVGNPAASQGKVFLPEENGVTVYDARSGTVVKVFGAPILPWRQPVVDGRDIYFRDSNSGAWQYDHTTGAQVHHWSGRAASQWAGPSVPALDAQYMYYYNTGNLFQIARASGDVVSTLRTDRTEYNESYANSYGSPVLHGDRQALFIESIDYGEDTGLGTLFDVDFASGARRWALRGKFRGNPVVAGGTAYALDGMRIVAVRLADGGSAWSWAVPAEEKSDDDTAYLLNLVVTDNLLFAAFKNHVYAIDLATQKTVWTFDRSGWLSVSPNGVMYVAASNGVFAFNLK